MTLSAAPSFLQRWHSQWQARQARSGQNLRWVLWAAAVLSLLLWWSIGLSAALTTLRTADAQRSLLQTQLQTVQALAVEEAVLQKMPPLPQPGADSRRQALELGLRQHLGSTAQLSVANERATASFRNVPGDALARWLIQSREAAHAFPLSAHLSLNAGRTAWEGIVVLALQPP